MAVVNVTVFVGIRLIDSIGKGKGRAGRRIQLLIMMALDDFNIKIWFIITKLIL
jgi:hypothetical protein